MRKALLSILIAMLGLSAQAQVVYWNMPTTADQVAYGRGSYLISREPQGMMINASSLGFLKYRSFSASGIQWWQDVYGGSATAMLPFGRMGSAGFSLGYWSLGTVTGYTEDGRPLGTIQSQASNLGLAYGLVLYNAWGLGISLKGSRLELPDRNDWGWASDLSLTYKRGALSGVLIASDLGPDYPKNNDIKYPLSTVYMAGAGYALWGGKACGSFQYNIRESEKGYPGLALSIAPLPNLILKAGYDDVPELSDRSPFGFGMEVNKIGKRDLNVSYGFRSYGNLGNIQAITMGVCF